MKPGSLGDSGLTFIETMIGIALLTLIISGVATFMRNTGQSLSAQEARSSFEVTSKQLLKLIDRDIRLQAAPATIGLGGLQLKVVRLQKASPTAPKSTYEVTFTSQCSAGSSAGPEVQSIVGKVFAPSQIAGIMAKGNQCLARLACAAGQYPTIVITTSVPPSTTVPTYTPSVFPDFAGNASLRRRAMKLPLGMAVCFDAIDADRTKVTLESVIAISPSAEQASFRVLREEGYFTRKNLAGVQVLP